MAASTEEDCVCLAEASEASTLSRLAAPARPLRKASQMSGEEDISGAELEAPGRWERSTEAIVCVWGGLGAEPFVAGR